MARRVDLDGFIRQLEQGPQDPLYLVSGDEPLLVIEACDALRAAARNAGYGERSSFVLDARSDWSAILGAAQNTSLFGDKQLLDLAIPTGKPGKTGADTLQRLADMIAAGQLPDTVVLVHLPQLDKATRNSKWLQALGQIACSVEVPSIGRSALPGWIGQRLARQEQKLDRESLEWMADKVEGNLLAAHQEVQKLGLLYPPGPISLDDVQRAVLNVARYDVFGLRDAMLAGNGDKALRVLEGLKAEGEALPFVLWAVSDEMRVLARLASSQAAGEDLGAAMRRHRVFGHRESLLRQALTRVPAATWPAAVQHAHEVDRLIKGLKVPGRLDDPWQELSRLVLRIALAGTRRRAG